jgi:hypothetical protein
LSCDGEGEVVAAHGAAAADVEPSAQTLAVENMLARGLPHFLGGVERLVVAHQDGRRERTRGREVEGEVGLAKKSKE